MRLPTRDVYSDGRIGNVARTWANWPTWMQLLVRFGF